MTLRFLRQHHTLTDVCLPRATGSPHHCRPATVGRAEVRARQRGHLCGPSPRRLLKHLVYLHRDRVTPACFPRAFLLLLLNPAWTSFLSVLIDPRPGPTTPPKSSPPQAHALLGTSLSTHTANIGPSAPSTGREGGFTHQLVARHRPTSQGPRSQGRDVLDDVPFSHHSPPCPTAPTPTSASWGHLPNKLLAHILA